MRISDHERQRALDELAEHMRAGRLGMDDYIERMGEVHAAETLADIDRARRNLPWMRIALPPGAGGATPALTSTAPGGGGSLFSRLALLLSAVLVVAGVVLAVTAEVVWSVMLVTGWLVGVALGRASARRR